MPDIRLAPVLNLKQSSIKLSDFRGKLVLLDFWATWCSPCIGTMPKMQKIQHRFGDRVQVLLVTPDEEDVVKEFYKKRPNLVLPTAVIPTSFDTLAKRVGIPTLGVYAWIDSAGILQAVTSSEYVTVENIQAFLDGKSVNLPSPYNYGQKTKLDMSKPFLADGNGGGAANIKYHSVFSGPIAGIGGGVVYGGSEEYKGRRVFVFNSDIAGLYQQAVAGGRSYGSWAGFPASRTVVETDSSRVTRKNLANIYSYELIIPPERGGELYDIMLAELNQFFGLYGRLEKRMVPALALVTHGAGPKPSVGSTTQFISEFDSLTMSNQQPKLLAQYLETVFMRPVLDETGISTPIDVSWNNLPKRDLLALNQALEPYGLEVREAERELEVLVISKSLVSPRSKE